MPNWERKYKTSRQPSDRYLEETEAMNNVSEKLLEIL
jgi:hypothetical protein